MLSASPASKPALLRQRQRPPGQPGSVCQPSASRCQALVARPPPLHGTSRRHRVAGTLCSHCHRASMHASQRGHATDPAQHSDSATQPQHQSEREVQRVGLHVGHLASERTAFISAAAHHTAAHHTAVSATELSQPQSSIASRAQRSGKRAE